MERVEKIKRTVSSQPRVGLTEFARSKKWRESLEVQDIIEIVDRTETAGYLVSPEGMRILLDSIETLEKEVEQSYVDALFASREGMDDWLSGDDLALRAKESLRTRESRIRRLLDGD